MQPETILGGGFLATGFLLVGYFITLHWSAPRTPGFALLVRSAVFATGATCIVVGGSYAL